MDTRSERIPRGVVSSEELTNFVDDLPALLWRVDIVRNKIEYLNDNRDQGLGDKSGLLLKNIDYSRQVILPEDFRYFEEFMKALHAGKTMATVFRVKTEGGDIRWLKLTGTRDRHKPNYYIGFLLDISETAEIVRRSVEQDAEREAMIEMADNPVILIDALTRVVVAFNMAAGDLFEYRPEEFFRLNFGELYHRSFQQQISRICEDLIFEKKWEGKIHFRRKNNTSFLGKTSLILLFVKGRHLYRISIHEIETDDINSGALLEGSSGLSKKLDPGLSAHGAKLLNMIGRKNNMEEILGILLDNQYGGRFFDSIIYSDVYSKKNKVCVYTAGDAFASMQQGQIYPYEGTIAENIDRFKLEYLIVDDTFSSIKPIDWALFVPHGIRSYFAQPFYEKKLIRTVLILCSKEGNMFSDAKLTEYAVLYPAFLQGLKNYRQRLKAEAGAKH
jgi:hypothetical protein